MKQTLKVKIANLSTWIMISTVGLIILWFIGFMFSNTFNLNVFTNRTSEFFFVLIGFAFVLVTCAAILNISLNISLIADSKIAELHIDKTQSFFSKRFFYFSGFIVLVLIGFMFLGDFATRNNEKNKLETEAKDLIDRYEQSINELTIAIQDTSLIEKVPEILKILSNQKKEFPTVSIISCDKYENETIYLQIDSWSYKESLKKPYFDYSFYKCNKEESDYLKTVFSKENDECYLWSEKSEYKFYHPIERNGKRVVLLFSKYERYGKIGS